MQLKNLQTRKQNLENIALKVNNDKNILLIDIMKLTKKLKYYVANAVSNKQLINMLEQKYKFRNDFISKQVFKSKTLDSAFHNLKRKFTKAKQLIVYVTEKQKYSTDSYSRYERLIKNKVKNLPADFITIGERSLSFCNENKYNVLKSFELQKHSTKQTSMLASMIKLLYAEFNYESVHFVINSNKNFNDSFCVLPLKSFDIDKFLNQEQKQSIDAKQFDKFKIFPDIETFLNTQVSIFLENAIQSLMVESSFYESKNTLVNLNQITKQLDEEQLKLSKKLISLKREKEIEEIILLTKNNESSSLSSLDKE